MDDHAFRYETCSIPQHMTIAEYRRTRRTTAPVARRPRTRLRLRVRFGRGPVSGSRAG
jgi:hypothetical protein